MMASNKTGQGQWHDRDAWLIVLMRGLRSCAYGMLAVLLAVTLAQAGLAPAAIGGLITVSLTGDVVGTYVIGLFADQWGRRRTLAILALLMAGTGVVFGLTTNYVLLSLAAFFGTLGISASETAPFLPIEQAMLAQAASHTPRTALFARYNLVASCAGALGALSAGLPDLLVRHGVPPLLGLHLFFGVYAAVALVVAGLALRLSPTMEGTIRSQPETQKGWKHLVPNLSRSLGIVWKLTGLFSVDALAGGLVVQSLMVLFFHLRFGVSLSLLALLFFVANTFSALSFLAAAPLARRIGLLATMVWTHLPSNVLLILVAFAPTFPLAAALLLARQVLSQMDVPTRQAYTMALVAPAERTAAASVTSLARSIGAATSPIFSGLLLQGPVLVLGIPFILAGTLKAIHDGSLWVLFRRVPVKEVTAQHSDRKETGAGEGENKL
jgi:MFS family permease